MNEFVDAAIFYCDALGVDHTKVMLYFTEDDDDDVAGSCEKYEDGTYLIRLLTVKLEDENDPLAILAHEIVHVWQYETGLLVDLDDCRCLWKGKVYLDPACYTCPVLYMNAPWEQQAFALQNKLHQNYLRSMGQ